MADLGNVVNAQMSAMIDGKFGCLDAAVEAINSRTGQSVNKGTLSKRLSGQHGWPVDDVAALEDACGCHPVTRMLARRLNPDEQTARGSMLLHAGAISKESGEAVSAILAAQQSDNDKDHAQALVEIDEAIDALQRARSRIVVDT